MPTVDANAAASPAECAERPRLYQRFLRGARTNAPVYMLSAGTVNLTYLALLDMIVNNPHYYLVQIAYPALTSLVPPVATAGGVEAGILIVSASYLLLRRGLGGIQPRSQHPRK